MRKYEVRREQAKKLREKRNLRSPNEQIINLDKRLGEGVGAKKERSILQKIIQLSNPQELKKNKKKREKSKEENGY